MLIARGSSRDGTTELLLLGLTRGNIERLIAGRAIKLTAESHPGIPEGWVINIVFGETEQAIAEELRAVGAVTDDTRIVVDPRLSADGKNQPS